MSQRKTHKSGRLRVPTIERELTETLHPLYPLISEHSFIPLKHILLPVSFHLRTTQNGKERGLSWIFGPASQNKKDIDINRIQTLTLLRPENVSASLSLVSTPVVLERQFQALRLWFH